MKHTYLVSSYGVLQRQYSFSFFLPLPPPPGDTVLPTPGEPEEVRCCFLGLPPPAPPRATEGGLIADPETGVDFRFPLPVRTSSCLLLSALVLAASSFDTSFCNRKR